MKLFELLAKNTDEEFGSYSIEYNEHHGCYVHQENYPDTYEEEVINYYVDKNNYTVHPEGYLPAVANFKKHVKDFNNVYHLRWYINTPVGFNSFYGSSIEDIEKQVVKFLGGEL